MAHPLDRGLEKSNGCPPGEGNEGQSEMAPHESEKGGVSHIPKAGAAAKEAVAGHGNTMPSAECGQMVETNQ